MDALVRASGLRGYPALMRDLGCDPTPLLQRYHLDEGALGSDDAMISLRAVVHLLEASAEQTRTGDLGLRLSRHQSIDVLGPLSIALQNAPTIRAAMDFAARHTFVHSPGLVYAVHKHSEFANDAAEVSIEIRLSRQPAQRQTIDLCLADIHNFTRLLAGDRYLLRAVSVPHTPVVPVSTYERFFGARVWVEQPRASLHLSRSTLAADLLGVDATLRRIAEDYIFRHFGSEQGSVSDRVRQVLRQTLGTSSHSKATVADLLALHPRTMQRRLAAEATSFEAIRDDVRRELAMRYLCETSLPLGQISLLLGLPAQSALSRACRQWYGVPPSALRKHKRAAD
ncbi:MULTISPECIES: AraC family transcriptional regulator [Cupriavidus]|uniref:Transcriptional regulator, AraC family n=1 Tax=Cupriavidus pinatubonensis (strain JMP 134 / LMG 1197) TaxID=264198 RepID=Q46QT2_CUPPJ|nr:MULTISPECIES: AraC family transcriptional regulator [Cupriavidus]TPQ33128.1 AraC family transcriptional regulator [Cupriavidus pinatubonensis]